MTVEEIARMLYEKANAPLLAADPPTSSWDDILAQGPEETYEEYMRMAYAVHALLEAKGER